MPTSYAVARDEMFAKLLAGWTAGAASIVGYVPELKWPGEEDQNPQATEVYWGRVSLAEGETEQSGLSAGAYAPDGAVRRYTSFGLIYVQLFGPRHNADAVQKLALLSQCAQAALRGETPSGVVFYDASFRSMLPEAVWEGFIVKAEYEFDSIG